MPKVLNKYHLLPTQTGVFIGRPSVYRNPFPIEGNDDRDKVCDKHVLYLLSRPDAIEHIRKTLPNRNLVCFCAPKRCHGDFIFRLANSTDAPWEIAEELLQTSIHWEKRREEFYRLWAEHRQAAQQERSSPMR